MQFLVESGLIGSSPRDGNRPIIVLEEADLSWAGLFASTFRGRGWPSPTCPMPSFGTQV